MDGCFQVSVQFVKAEKFGSVEPSVCIESREILENFSLIYLRFFLLLIGDKLIGRNFYVWYQYRFPHLKMHSVWTIVAYGRQKNPNQHNPKSSGKMFGELKKFDKIITGSHSHSPFPALSLPNKEFQIVPFIKMPGMTIQPQINQNLKMSSDKGQVYGTWGTKWWLHFGFQIPMFNETRKFFFCLKITAWNLFVGPSIHLYKYVWAVPMELLSKQNCTHFW